MQVEDVLEVCLYAADLDAAEAFYREILGLDLVVRSPGRHLFFRCGDRMLLLFNPQSTLTQSELPAHGASGPSHIAFAIAEANLEAWKRRLIGKGVAIEQETVWPNGVTSLYFRDPAGNSLELTARRLWGV